MTPSFYLILTVTLPYTMNDFNKVTLQIMYKAAISTAAGTTADLVDILSISNARRAGSATINVKTKIRAQDAASLNAIESNLGSGQGLKIKVNEALKAQGLRESQRIEIETSAIPIAFYDWSHSHNHNHSHGTESAIISHKHNHYHNHSQNHSHGTESTVYVIIGAAVGGTFVLLLLIIAAVVCYRGREANPATATAAAADQQFNSIYADEDPSRERGSNHIVSMTTEADPSPMPFEPVPAYANSLEGVHDVCWQQLNVQQARKEVKEFGAAAASKPLSTLGQTAQQSEKEDNTAAATAAVTAAATITSMAVEPTPSGSRSNCDLEQGVLQKRHDGWDHIEKAKEFLHKGLISQDDYDDIKDNWLMKLKDMTL